MRTIRLDVSITAGYPEIRSLNRSCTSQMNNVVVSGSSLPNGGDLFAVDIAPVVPADDVE